MKEKRKELLHDIQNRFNILIVVSILYTTVISGFFDFLKSDSSETITKTSLVTILYIMAYIVFEIFKDKFGVNILKAYAWLVLISILLPAISAYYLINIITQQTFSTLWLSTLTYSTFVSSLLLLIVLPIFLVLPKKVV